MFRRDSRFPALTAAVLLGVTSIPYLYGWLTTPSHRIFLWGVGFLPDTLGNLVFTRQGADGFVLFDNPFTSEPHPRRFFHPFFLALGWAQRITGWEPGLVFQLGRLAAAAALVFAVCRLSARLFPTPGSRRAGALAVLFTGGIGWMSAFVPALAGAADVRGAEMFTFFSLYQQGHFAAALAVIVWAALATIRAFDTGSVRDAATAGVLNALLIAIHPYDAPLPYAATAAYAVLLPALGIGRLRWRMALIIAAVPLPLIAYNGWLAQFVPVYREFAREGLVARPWPLADYLAGFGLLLPFAALGLRQAVRTRDRAWAYPVAWVLVVPVLMLAPIPARRKLMEGCHLFLALLAARGAVSLGPMLGRLLRPLAAAGFLGASCSGVYVMARDVYAIDLSRRPGRDQVRLEAGTLLFPFDGPAERAFAGSPWMGGILLRGLDRYDLPASLRKAMAWLAEHAPRDAVVVAAPETGLFVPMFAPQHVVAGHIFGTLRYAEKVLAVRTLMDGELPDDARRHLLHAHGVGIVLSDDALRRLGTWDPERAGWLERLAGFGGPPEGSTPVAVLGVPASSPPGAAYERVLRAELAASGFKLRGVDFLAEGRNHLAAEAFDRARRLRPHDRDLPDLLSEAARRAGARPPP